MDTATVAMNMLLWAGDVTDPRFEALFAMLADAGYDGVEVPVFALDPKPYAQLGERLQGMGLRALALTARGPQANPISADPDVRAAGLRENVAAIECAAALGAEILCGPFLAAPQVLTGAAPTDEEVDWAVEHLQALAEPAQRHGLTLAVESLNHFEHYLANTAEQTARIVRKAGRATCRMMYDTFHAHMEEKDVEAAIRACADVLAYVHISENDRSTPGSGQVAWDATFTALHAVDYHGWLTVEALGNGDPQLAAEMKIWRRAYDTEERLAREAVRFVREAWARTATTGPSLTARPRGAA
jgi:D-psicose/D-tagatose/L-ribulose 3-epimerase